MRRARDRARAALDLLELDGLRNDLPQELSGGQAQRVVIARVLAARPALILADEPTSQLDRDTAAHVTDVLLQVSDEIGAALVVATHDETIGARLNARSGRCATVACTRARTPAPAHARRSQLMIRIWLPALLRRQPARLLGAAVGVAIAVALLASLGAFLAHAKASMTGRAVRSVSVDWQVQVAAGTDPAGVAALVAQHPGVVQASQTVGFTRVPGLSATSAGSTQTTGAGVVLGLPPSYQATFPGEIRSLTGSRHRRARRPADRVQPARRPGLDDPITRPGLPPLTVTVAGVVDLPQANSLFQTVGAPAGSQPSAPPDNVHPAAVRTVAAAQHAARRRPPRPGQHPDPRPAQPRPAHRPRRRLRHVLAAAHNLEARSTGTATVGNNLGAALDSARGDAAYAQVLFLFLGLPGAVLAGLLTATVASAGARRRRGEQALLRIRGASQPQLLRLASVEAALIGVVGCVVGLAAALLVGQTRLRLDELRRHHRISAAVVRARRRRRSGDHRPRGPGPRTPRRAGSHVASGRQEITRAATPGGPVTGSTSLALSAPDSSSTRPAITATSSCSPPRACRRSRCPTGRWPDRRCCGSAPDC